MRPKFHFIDVMTHSVCLRQNKMRFHSLNPQKFNCAGFARGGGWVVGDVDVSSCIDLFYILLLSGTGSSRLFQHFNLIILVHVKRLLL